MNASCITRQVIKKFQVSIKRINSGHCYWWAWLFYQKYGGRFYSMKNCGGHAFIKYKGLYFDSTRPKGVKEWKELGAVIYLIRYYKRYDAVPNVVAHTKQQFAEHWGIS